jgi:hypothetical protein
VALLSRWTWLALLALLTVPTAARAGCCRLVRIDAAAQTTVRACETDANDACLAVLFEGVLAQGAATWLCSATDAIVYQDIDPVAGGYNAPVGAVCAANADVEL